jgi:hypothetical protein
MQTTKLSPIRPGYAFSHDLSFCRKDSTDLGFSFLSFQRVYGQFRREANKNSTLLATVDTNNNTLVVVNDSTLRIVLNAEATQAFPPGVPAWIDFALKNDTEWGYVPVLISWPVVDTVTIPPLNP